MTTHTTELARDDDSGLALVEAALADLRVSAPPSLLPDTLVAAGLADHFVTVSSALGPLFVAWNGRGVSTIIEATDAGAFEARFRAEFGRPVSRGVLPGALARAIAARLAGDR